LVCQCRQFRLSSTIAPLHGIHYSPVLPIPRMRSRLPAFLPQPSRLVPSHLHPPPGLNGRGGLNNLEVLDYKGVCHQPGWTWLLNPNKSRPARNNCSYSDYSHLPRASDGFNVLCQRNMAGSGSTSFFRCSFGQD